MLSKGSAYTNKWYQCIIRWAIELHLPFFFSSTKSSIFTGFLPNKSWWSKMRHMKWPIRKGPTSVNKMNLTTVFKFVKLAPKWLFTIHNGDSNEAFQAKNRAHIMQPRNDCRLSRVSVSSNQDSPTKRPKPDDGLCRIIWF